MDTVANNIKQFYNGFFVVSYHFIGYSYSVLRGKYNLVQLKQTHYKRSAETMKRFIFFLLPLLFLLASVRCSKKDDNILAIVGNRKITIDKFKERFISIKKKISLPDNLQVRREILQNMVDEELLIFEAEKQGYNSDSAAKNELNRIKVQELLNSFLNENVFPKINIEETDLKNLHWRLNTRVNARHLYATSRNEADSLYQALMQGKTFHELAKSVFKDPKLKNNGGLLGFFTVDEMDPAFEDAAFALKKGEISKPVHTAQGYSIIKVEDRISKPILTETEYQNKRPQLEQYCLYRKRKEATKAFVDSVRRSLDIKFDKDTVRKLYKILRTHTSEPIVEHLVALDVDPDFQTLPLVSSKYGTWDVKTFQSHSQLTSETQQQWIRSDEMLEDFVAGLMVREWILEKSRTSGCEKSDQFKQNVQERMDDYLLKRIESEVAQSTNIPDDTLRAYFDENSKDFITPPKIHLYEIALRDELLAKEIYEKLKKNKSFRKLAKKYSVRQWSAEKDGDLGEFTFTELGKYAEQLFALKDEQFTRPLLMDSLFVIFKCVGKTPQRAQSYQGVKPQIIKILAPFWQKKVRQEAISTIHRKYDVEIFPEKLKSIEL